MEMKRRGTIAESLLSMVLLVVVAMALIQVTNTVMATKTRTRDTVFLSLHNVNCYEKLRQELIKGDGQILKYYGDDYLGSSTIYTEANVEVSTLDTYSIYEITVSSRQRATKTKLRSTYLLTNIGLVG